MTNSPVIFYLTLCSFIGGPLLFLSHSHGFPHPFPGTALRESALRDQQVNFETLQHVCGNICQWQCRHSLFGDMCQMTCMSPCVRGMKERYAQVVFTLCRPGCDQQCMTEGGMDTACIMPCVRKCTNRNKPELQEHFCSILCDRRCALADEKSACERKCNDRCTHTKGIFYPTQASTDGNRRTHNRPPIVVRNGHICFPLCRDSCTGLLWWRKCKSVCVYRCFRLVQKATDAECKMTCDRRCTGMLWWRKCHILCTATCEKNNELPFMLTPFVATPPPQLPHKHGIQPQPHGHTGNTTHGGHHPDTVPLPQSAPPKPDDPHNFPSPHKPHIPHGVPHHHILPTAPPHVDPKLGDVPPHHHVTTAPPRLDPHLGSMPPHKHVPTATPNVDPHLGSVPPHQHVPTSPPRVDPHLGSLPPHKHVPDVDSTPDEKDLPHKMGDNTLKSPTARVSESNDEFSHPEASRYLFIPTH